ncbi:methylmalonyl-CoA epimerase [Chytriomyces confervae]|uniref:Methylmalonyl-CoA epimerase, mitochondrial n=1 Tax=Chytriomyces confervae TaxID=246404 RepID=A0A507EZK3_9FUNG|nr:methylmalonyl-CoA epimerase [Chytriomyces confervae]
MLPRQSLNRFLQVSQRRSFVNAVAVPPKASGFCMQKSSNTNRNVAYLQLFQLGILNHVAIATPNLEKATAFYRDILNGECSEQIPLPEHGVTTVFVNLGNTKIELLHPLGDKSPIAGFLAKNKEGGMHHVCIEVDNVYTAMADVKAKGVRVLDKEPKIGAHGKPVVFLHPKDCGGVLVELEQR